MWWIVYFWAHDPTVGEYLDHRKFYDFEDAELFAEEHNSKVESTLR
jgi:hypothetical protein